MMAKNIAIASVLAVCAVGAALWLGNVGHWFAEAQTEPEVIDVENNPFLEVVDSPPKAVADSLVHDFGVMQRGDAGEHEFTLKNEGEGLLRVLKGKSTCTCTKFELGDDEDLKRLELKPGESIKVMVAWKVKEASTGESFRTSATLHTNDPDNKSVAFEITGKIVTPIFSYPGKTVIAPDVVNAEPVHVSAIVGSKLWDDLELVSAETDSDLLTIESKKLVFENGFAEGIDGKCGYQLEMTISPDIPVGSFQAPVRVKLRDSNGKTFDEELNVTTTRTGPIKVVAPNFDVHTMTLNFKDFDITAGKSTDLTMFVTVSDVSQEHHFDVVKSTNENVHMKIVRDENFKGEKLQRYVVSIEIPPGALTVPENEGRAEFVVKTDLPDVEAIHFRVKYQAY